MIQARDLFLSSEISEEQAQAFLSACGYRDPQRADRLLRELAESSRIPERLAELAPAFLDEASKSADPDAMLGRLQGLFEASPNPRNLVSFLLEDRQASKRLPRLLGASNFVAQTLVRNPEYVYWLLDPRSIDQVPRQESFQEGADEAVAPFHRLLSALDALRRFRRRQQLRIAAQDVLGLAELPEITSQISWLAEAVLQTAYRLLGEGFPSPGPGFAVVALGKLGGTELNFSSDIDLAYVYSDREDDGQMIRFARRLTEALDEPSTEGRLYRVDLRLRPMGRGGEIAYSLSAYRNYFETWADTADRLAYLKCRWVAGDADLGRKFEILCSQFVFRRYIDLAAVEEIRWLKRRTDRMVRGRGEHRSNLKLGIGGIREIEFFAQAFQLLYGAQHEELRTPNTLKALARLVDRDMIRLDDYQKLRSAYVFLRSLEHKLQLAEDRQTHTLPRDPEELKTLGRLMALSASSPSERGQHPLPSDPAAALNSRLQRCNAEVRSIFEALFEEKRLPEGFEELLLNPSLRGEEGVQWLTSHGISPAREIHRGLHMLASAPAFPTSPSRLRNLAANLAPRLVAAASRMPEPDRLFSRLERLGEAVGSHAGLYQELVENRTFAQRLLRLLSTGEFLSETLISSPQLLDSLARLPEALPEAGRAFFAHLSAEKRHDFDELRRLKRREEFKVAAAELSNCWTTLQSRRVLSELADACLAWAVEELLLRNPRWQSGSFLLLALGKLGGRELTYHSDLDLVLVYDESNPLCQEADYAQFIKALHEALEKLTEAGRAYRLDFRLRPEGRHGPPAVPLGAWRRYFEGRLQAWERLAYVKARTIVQHCFEDSLDSLFRQQRLFSEPELLQLAHLRRRKENELSGEQLGGRNFKVGRGGLMDIQFVVQHLQIRNGTFETGTCEAVEGLVQAQALEEGIARELLENLDFLLRLEARRRLTQERPSNSLPVDPAQLELLSELLGLESPQSLLKEYDRVTTRTRRIYRRFFADSV